MKKRIAREVLYIVSFVLIIGLFSVCIVSYNKMNINKLNKILPELQNNFSYLQEKNIQSVCFNNGKFDYTIPIDMIGDFTSNRSDLNLAGKIDELGIPVKLTKKEQAELDQLNGIKQDLTLDKGFEEVKIDFLPPADGFVVEKIPIKDNRESSNTSKEIDLPSFDEVMQQGNSKSIEKLSTEESEQINAYIANTKSYKKYSNLILTEKDIYYNIKIVALILLIAFFLVRYLYYSVSWSLKILKE